MQDAESIPCQLCKLMVIEDIGFGDYRGLAVRVEIVHGRGEETKAGN